MEFTDGLKVGDRVVVNTPSMAMGWLYLDIPSRIDPTKYVGKVGTVMWTKDFRDPDMQGIKVRFVVRTGWSYFTGREFTLVSS